MTAFEGEGDYGPGCECSIVPEKYHFSHYGATEPGSMYEWNPECPVHGEGME